MAEERPPYKKVKLDEFVELKKDDTPEYRKKKKEEEDDQSEYKRIAASLNKCPDISKAVDGLISKEHFCFVKLKNCNGAYPVCFSKAWCAPVRNTEEEDKAIWQPRVRFSDLFSVELFQKILVNSNDVRLSKLQMMLFDKLIQFLATINDVSRILEDHRESTEAEWAALFGTHVLRPLAIMNSMLLSDSGYTRIKDCPCGCKIPIVMGDTSMGHKNVWHGSVDILLGSNVAICNTSDDSEPLKEEKESDFEIKSHNIETDRPQIIAQTIVFSFVKNIGVVPTIAISKQVMKIFMYDPDNDLLFESTQMKLFPNRATPVLNTHTVLALWFAINYSHFCTGTKPSHIKFGYKADFYSSLDQTAQNTYKSKLHLYNCKYGDRTGTEFLYDSYEEVTFL